MDRVCGIRQLVHVVILTPMIFDRPDTLLPAGITARPEGRSTSKNRPACFWNVARPGAVEPALYEIEVHCVGTVGTLLSQARGGHALSAETGLKPSCHDEP